MVSVVVPFAPDSEKDSSNNDSLLFILAWVQFFDNGNWKNWFDSGTICEHTLEQIDM